MDTIKDFEIKQRKYMPIFTKASGKPTIYLMRLIHLMLLKFYRIRSGRLN
ncbi:hypothetical protein J4G08_14200 [Candidatus Poribacteria bacterium]|nr:hypothetical protein [Candidatus Poribacteria bacterium]